MILTATYSEIAENKKVDKPFFRGKAEELAPTEKTQVIQCIYMCWCMSVFSLVRH